MRQTTAVESSATTASRGLVLRLAGVLTSPRATYADVAARPRWFGALAVVLLVSAGSVGAFMATRIGQRALLDEQLNTMESFGIHATDAQMQLIEARLPYAPYFAAAGQMITLPLAALVLAGLALAVFNAGLGGDATFRQTFSVVAHSGVLIALRQLFVLPLDYARESMSNPTNLAVFLPFLDENTFLSRMMGSIDLWVIWWSVSLAIGFGVLYRRRSASIALSFLGLYVVLAIVVAAVRTAFSGA